ncbi:hypothetical protein GGS20DRAFT_497651 [Poronia punctata]|nr:hypothetical protein GGS20DRAFT_497651 [Poronia punctata]
MKTQLYYLSLLLFATAQALPSGTSMKCGPNSNCEMVNINGTRTYRFKSGMEPGSLDHTRRFQRRQDDEEQSGAELRVIMGEMRMQWGCDTDVGQAMADAISESCRATAGCDSGKTKGIEVAKWEGTRSEPSGATLNIKVEGKYYDEEVRDVFAEAMRATAHDESVETEESKWLDEASPSASQWGLSDRGGDCAIKNFPNYVAINRFEDENLKDYMEIHAELVEGESNCLGATILGAIAGAINPLAGKVFGFAKVLCESEL